MTTHERAHAHTAAKPDTHDAATDVAIAAQTLESAAERLGPRLTEHAYGCPAHASGGCNCGTTDFLAAMVGLKTALEAVPPPANGG